MWGAQPGSTAEPGPREWGTSPGEHRLSLGVNVPPEPAGASLPQSYGLALLELLVVDPHYLFVSWEIPSAQLAQARAALGEAGYPQRQLELRLQDAAGAVLMGQRLYGEQGRWFIRHDLAGRLVRAELGFHGGLQFHSLNVTGPLQLPRNYIIEPAEYSELHVQYGSGPAGELRLAGTSSRPDLPWPELSLPAPVLAELTDAARERLDRLSSGMPTSPGLGPRTMPATGETEMGAEK